MTAILVRVPSFQQAQQVSFVGGEGVVRNFKLESGSWTYVIEMALGLEPPFGRIGAETMVLLTEADLWADEAEADYNFLTSPRN
ncbi:hypothetical protein [Phormidesmis priestleyi]